jgi:hypothetical protein
MNRVVATLPGRELLVLDNNVHKKCDRWLKKHPKVHFHFTPTRSSWLNQIETWFSILQGQSLTGASFTSVEQLQQHIDAFIAAYNEKATPFAWTKKKVYRRRFKSRRITQVCFRVLGVFHWLQMKARIGDSLPLLSLGKTGPCANRIASRPIGPRGGTDP